MKSSDWRELAAYRATGLTPEQVAQMQQYTTDPAPLTDEQREQLKAIWMLGYRWLVKDMTGDAFAFGFTPVKNNDWLSWMLSPDDKNEMVFALNKDLNACSLVSWSDPEPFDIGKALGVEG